MNEPLNMNGINLEPVIIKAMDKEEGHGWSFDFACRVAAEYQRFLTLCRSNPDIGVVPSAVVDDFWHLHILDTQKYAEDCDRFFGYFLHHFPYFGMRDAQDARNLKAAWELSLALYEAEFGEKPPADLWPKSRRCPNCGRRAGVGFDSRRPSFADMGLSAA